MGPKGVSLGKVADKLGLPHLVQIGSGADKEGSGSLVTNSIPA